MSPLYDLSLETSNENTSMISIHVHQSDCHVIIFVTLDFFLSEKKIVLVRGKESRGKGSKRDEKGPKKMSIFLHRTCGSAVT